VPDTLLTCSVAQGSGSFQTTIASFKSSWFDLSWINILYLWQTMTAMADIHGSIRVCTTFWCTGIMPSKVQKQSAYCCCIYIFLVCFALSRIMMFDGIIFSDDCRSSIFTVVPPVAMHGHIRRVNWLWAKK
jgi:hypothetical protein